MIVLNVRYTAKDGKREEFLSQVESRGILERIRGEKGNIGYEYFISRENENQVLLLEKWEDEQVLEAHLKAPHMAELREIKDCCVESTEMVKFKI